MSRHDRPREFDAPTDATEEEAAAIAAAIGSYLAERERARVRLQAQRTGADDDSWDGRRWAVAGRLAATRGRSGRVPDGAPTDSWVVADRVDRF